MPGDLISDLASAGFLSNPDVLFENTFLDDQAMWADNTWVYRTTFSLGEGGLSAAETAVLVLEGVKMAASVALDGVPLGETTDQFVCYRFPLDGAALADGTVHELTVTFAPPVGPDAQPTGGRFSAQSGGWDWGPYSSSFEGPDHTFSKGLWYCSRSRCAQHTRMYTRMWRTPRGGTAPAPPLPRC